MYDHILVVTDGRSNTRSAVHYAITLAAKERAHLHVLYLTDTPGLLTRATTSLAAAVGSRREDVPADTLMELAASTAREADVPLETETVAGELCEVVPEYAVAHGMDHVVVNRIPLQGLHDHLRTGDRGKLARHLDIPLTFIGDPATEVETFSGTGQPVSTQSPQTE